MADLKDRFKFDEIIKKPSIIAPRNESGNIVVRNIDGIKIPHNLTKKQEDEFVKRKKEGKPITSDILKSNSSKNELPYGSEPIRDKIVNPKTKEELVKYYDSPYEPANESETLFAGETSAYIEIPKYDEDELKKAVDIKVDELIKPKKQERGEWVPKPKYDKLLQDFLNAQSTIADLTLQLNEAKSTIATLQGEIATLNATIVSLNNEILQKDIELAKFLERYNKLLEDYQNSVIKGTKEGIERVSLTAQVKGLQAQKETLQAQLQAQQDIVKALQLQSEIQQQVAETQQQAAEDRLEQAKKTNLLDIIGRRNHFEVKGDIGWASAESNKNIKPDFPVAYDDRKKDPRGVLSGMKFEFYNISEEDVTLNVTETVIKGVKWLNGVPSSIKIPKSSDGGSSPGTTSITLSRNNKAGEGSHDTIIKLKNPTTGDEFQIKTSYWQARKNRDT